MRIDVSAPATFFANDAYSEFEKYFAAAAAGLASIDAADPDKPIDVQINPVLMAISVGQYVLDPDGKFEEFTRGRSSATMEIDHINMWTKPITESLLCYTAVALAQAFYPNSTNVNCWSKLHGGKTDDTGWCEIQFHPDRSELAQHAVRSFITGEVNAEELSQLLTRALVSGLEE